VVESEHKTLQPWSSMANTSTVHLLPHFVVSLVLHFLFEIRSLKKLRSGFEIIRVRVIRTFLDFIFWNKKACAILHLRAHKIIVPADLR
jgi:hypothetical protein